MIKKIFLILILATSLGLSDANAQSGITVGTDSDLFEQGQTVTITGNTVQNNSVAIQVKDPTGASILVRSVTSDSDGNFSLQFKIPQHAVLGDYEIITNTMVGDSPVVQKTTFQVEKIESTQELPKKKGGGCLIATAAFGSEMAPQVQFLRELRDNTVLQTESGTSFMTGFNQFYYSFSPVIADYERENSAFKETVKIAITPMLTSLAILNYVDIDSEEEMLGYGIGIILLNIGMYFVAPAVIIFKIKNRK